jgi:hypothetical protein
MGSIQPPGGVKNSPLTGSKLSDTISREPLHCGIQFNQEHPMIRNSLLFSAILSLVFYCGCNPVGTVVKIGMKVVGKEVDDAETTKLGNKLIGYPPAKADQELGQPVDVWTDVYSAHEWRLYRPKLDVLDTKRTVVGVSGGRVVSVKMIERYGDDVDLPLEIFYYEKVKGKSPQECETELKMGPPMLTVRSSKTHELLQMYDARLVKELPSPHDCLVRFNENDQCTKVDLIEVEASTN